MWLAGADITGKIIGCACAFYDALGTDPLLKNRIIREQKAVNALDPTA